MRKFSAFILAFKLFSNLNPAWVYVDDGKVRYLFEKRGNKLVQGGITVHSYELPYSDSVVVGTEGKEHVYRGAISIRVTRTGELLIINRVKLQDAVKSILTTIPPNNKNGELLKLKSIMARTMLIYMARTNHIIPDSTEFFVYNGRDSEYPLGNFASNFTFGEVLTQNDSIIVPIYHLNSGGITEEGTEVDCPLDYLVSVIDTFAKYGQSFSWEKHLTEDSLYKVLHTRTLEPLEVTASGRVRSFTIDGDGTISAESVKAKLNLPSLLVYTQKKSDTIIIYGRGYGSGLGISMESADYMTSHGFSYIDVVHLFYGGYVNITRRQEDEELYRIPVVQYAKEARTCTHY